MGTSTLNTHRSPRETGDTSSHHASVVTDGFCQTTILTGGLYGQRRITKRWLEEQAVCVQGSVLIEMGQISLKAC
jgi:hypothetical protein